MLKIVKIILLPFSIMFWIVIRIRNFLYDHQFLFQKRYKIPIICVGNITVGGTGKTPIVIQLAQILGDVAVISRGYKKTAPGTQIVSNGKDILTDAKSGGDEPYLIASKTSAITICNKNRKDAIKTLFKKFNSKIIIFDDGFQHRKIAKDFQILVIDSPRFLGNKFLIPTGILRDNIYRMKNTDLIILSKTEDQNKEVISKQIKYLRKFSQNIIISYNISESLYNKSKKSITIDQLTNKNVIIFCGIGMPKNFINNFRKSCIKKCFVFADHYNYELSDINKIIDEAKSLESNYILTTEKDFVKIINFNNISDNIYYLDHQTAYQDSNFKSLNFKTYINQLLRDII